MVYYVNLHNDEPFELVNTRRAVKSDRSDIVHVSAKYAESIDSVKVDAVSRNDAIRIVRDHGYNNKVISVTSRNVAYGNGESIDLASLRARYMC